MVFTQSGGLLPGVARCGAYDENDKTDRDSDPLIEVPWRMGEEEI